MPCMMETSMQKKRSAAEAEPLNYWVQVWWTQIFVYVNAQLILIISDIHLHRSYSSVLLPTNFFYGWTDLPDVFLFCLWPQHVLFQNKQFFVSRNTSSVWDTWCWCIFPHTPNRRGTQNHFRNWSSGVLNCLLDPIGDQKRYTLRFGSFFNF